MLRDCLRIKMRIRMRVRVRDRVRVRVRVKAQVRLRVYIAISGYALPYEGILLYETAWAIISPLRATASFSTSTRGYGGYKDYKDYRAHGVTESRG